MSSCESWALFARCSFLLEDDIAFSQSRLRRICHTLFNVCTLAHLKLLSLLQDFYKFLKDDSALLRAADARWLLVPSETNSLYHSQAVNRARPPPANQHEEPEGTPHLGQGTHIHGLRIALPEEAIEIDAADGLVIGRGVDCHVTLDSPAVSRTASLAPFCHCHQHPPCLWQTQLRKHQPKAEHR